MDDKYYHCLTLHHKSNHQEKSDEAPEPERMEIDQARYSQPEHSDKPINFYLRDGAPIGPAGDGLVEMGENLAEPKVDNLE